MNWHDLFRGCAERFGWPPPVVLELTAGQAAAVLGLDRPRRTVAMTPQQLERYLASRTR